MMPKIVMPGLVPGIHVFGDGQSKTWMAGTSPAMTNSDHNALRFPLLISSCKFRHGPAP
jgi:hypothetical protein